MLPDASFFNELSLNTTIDNQLPSAVICKQYYLIEFPMKLIEIPPFQYIYIYIYKTKLHNLLFLLF